MAVVYASAQIRPFAPLPAVYNRDFEKDAVILNQVFDLNPVDNSYVSRWVMMNIATNVIKCEINL